MQNVHSPVTEDLEDKIRHCTILLVCSPHPFYLHLKVISSSHIHPGMPMTVTIESLEDYGMLVSAGPGVRGLVPMLHASDLGTAKAMQKYKVRAICLGGHHTSPKHEGNHTSCSVVSSPIMINKVISLLAP